MEVSAEEFSTTHDQLLKSAQYTLDQIKLNEGQRELNIVLDIGSGSGSITAVLADIIKCKKLIGLDIDDNMVEFAKQHHKRGNIDYLQCDVQLPWDQLNNEVKQLEGRCSLIYSGCLFHWIRDERQCAENLKKLLAPGGKIYACIVPQDDLIRLDGEAKEQLEKTILILQPGYGTRTWESALNNSGLRVEVVHEYTRPVLATRRFIEKFIEPVSYTVLLRHTDHDREKQKLVVKYKDAIEKNIYKRLTIDEQKQYHFDIKLAFILAIKK